MRNGLKGTEDINCSYNSQLSIFYSMWFSNPEICMTVMGRNFIWCMGCLLWMLHCFRTKTSHIVKPSSIRFWKQNFFFLKKWRHLLQNFYNAGEMGREGKKHTWPIFIYLIKIYSAGEIKTKKIMSSRVKLDIRITLIYNDHVVYVYI